MAQSVRYQSPDPGSCYVDTKLGFRTHTFITEELPVQMERIFPVSSKREDRYIMGESMGGLGT